MSRPRPIAVIGLDCAEASLVFREFRDELPHLRGLMESGSYGVLNSCHPPITVPAWACMTSGYDAGQLGVYGFRNRKDHSYENLSLALSTSIKKPRIWDHFSAAGRTSICLGVPQTFPILKPPKGIMISSFLTPDKESPWCVPKSLAPEVDRVAEGDYIIDARNFRTHDKKWLLEEIRTMTRRRFLVADHLATTQPWDLFWMVEMGTDRIHHGFWHYCDPTHPKFPGEDNPFRWALRDYYREIDGYIGRLLSKLPAETLVVVVSDHGAQPMYGGIAVNEWLIQKGYLVLHEYPSEPTPTPKLKIDWSQTRVWSEGGYYARVFFNVKGRERNGVIEPHEYEAWRDRIIAEMEALPGPDGQPIGTRVHRPEELFREQNNIPPDLITYWGMMSWRSVGTVGGREIYVPENDTGPDEANHDWSGIFISRDPLVAGGGEVEGLRLLDVGVSLLAAAGLPVPADTAGQPSIRWS
ncbi:MAG: alkaline phosphatase family protein [Pirellulales bacterium]|nr:alkaline phosphatase family protein [Pirellulales bacterium]